MSQDEIMTVLSTFGPLSAKEIAKAGFVNSQSAVRSLNSLVAYGEAWKMAGRLIDRGSSLCMYGAI